MPRSDEEREAWKEGCSIAVGSSVAVVVAGLFFGFPWQLSLLLFVSTAAFAALLTGLTLGDARKAARRRTVSHGILSAWADHNEGCFGTASTAFTGDAGRWKLSASLGFRGELFAVGRRDGVEVGIVCWKEDTDEGVAEPTAILVLLSEQRPPVRLRRQEVSRLGLPYGADSVEINGRELSVRYLGWPQSSSALDTMIDATVRVVSDMPHA